MKKRALIDKDADEQLETEILRYRLQRWRH